MSTGCSGCLIKAKQERIVDLLQSQKCKLENRLNEQHNLNKQIGMRVERLQHELYQQNQQKIKLQRMLYEAQIEKPSTSITYVGFTPIDPKHRIVLQKCEADIEAIQAKLTQLTVESEQFNCLEEEEQQPVILDNLEDDMDKLQQQLTQTNVLLSKLTEMTRPK